MKQTKRALLVAGLPAINKKITDLNGEMEEFDETDLSSGCARDAVGFRQSERN